MSERDDDYELCMRAENIHLHFISTLYSDFTYRLLKYAFSGHGFYINMNQHKISFPMIYKTCIFGEIDFFFLCAYPPFLICAQKHVSPIAIDGDFFSQYTDTLMKLLTKFQLYTILFGVKP